MKYTNKHNLPDSIVRAITNDTYDLKDKDKISVTALASPPKIRVLSLRHWDEIEEDISDNFWRLLGSAIHEVLERVEGEEIKEERFEEEINGKVLSGKVDLYNEKEKSLQDYKITSVYSMVFNPDGKDEWVKQLNCYAWLLRKHGKEVKKIEVIALLRDWQKSKVKDNYPVIPIQTVKIPLWADDYAERYIKERLTLHKKAEELSDDDIPPCTAEERWERDTTYAVYKGNNKTALRVFKSEEEALSFANGYKSQYKASLVIKRRKGKPIRCERYCPVRDFCNYYKEVKDGTKNN